MENFPDHICVSASAVRSKSPESEPKAKTANVYKPVPLAKRDLALHGDPLEKVACQTIRARFPAYEDLWKALIWDLTDRDFSNPVGQLRPECPERLRIFAAAHYTFLRSLMLDHQLLAVKNLSNDDSHPLEPYFRNERFLIYYSHLGRVRDMCCLMLETFEQEAGQSVSLRKGKELDFGLVQQHLQKRISKVCADSFNSWQAEVTNYRNLLHRTAHAVIIVNGTVKALRPDRVKSSTDWVETLNRPDNDFVSIEDVIKKHFDMISTWAKPLWDHFLAQVNGWRSDDKAFRERLGLPVH